ncbi:xaa-Pro aminopeptidase family enzyme [Thozetella sp. PMI_491]|nr:xaa-Pro aminopeptidase family enzyme [Thozetella sp. PMI_491]
MRATSFLLVGQAVGVLGGQVWGLETEAEANAWPHLPRYHTLPSLREQAELQDDWTKQRREDIPRILQKYGVDAWLVSQREYAEETVFWSLKSARQFSARRRSTLLFFANASGDASSYTWIDNTPKLWTELRAILEKEQPKTIVVDTHPQIAFSSGLHAGELDAIKEGLGPEWASRFTSEPLVAVEYIATQLPDRAAWYRRLQSTAWAMISEAFSERVITPGRTTTSDVEWWLREKIQQMNYTTWFHPSVTIIDGDRRFVLEHEDRDVINYGDFLHTDFGVTALGLNTDTQHLGYVLYPGETEEEVPEGLKAGLKKGNRLQDIVKSNMKIGKTGNDILTASLDQMHQEGIEGKIYSHPIGDFGHAAGTLIGMTNLQDEVPVLGDLPLLPNMYYSVELLVEHFVPEWNATLQFPLEEDIQHVGGDQWVWAYGRQETFHVIRTSDRGALRAQGGNV